MRWAGWGLLLVVGCAGPASSLAEPETLRGGLVTAPAVAWRGQEPSSSMRVAQYALEGPGGEASLVVFHFGSAGGTVEANFERWLGQFAGPDGSPAEADVSRSGSVGDLPLHELRVTGRYVAEVTPGSEERHDEADWRLLAAIVETPVGAYYLKLVGPEATVRGHTEAWEAYLEALAFAAPDDI